MTKPIQAQPVRAFGLENESRRGKKRQHNWMVFAFVLAYSLLPTSLQPLIRMPPFYINVVDAMILLLGLAAYLFCSIGALRFEVDFFVPLSWLVLIMAVAGISGSPYFYSHTVLSLSIPIAVLILTPFCALAAVKWARTPSLNFAHGLALCVAFISTEYIAATVIGPMLGFRGGRIVSLGDDRISGSLGNAATLHVVLIPALSVFIWNQKKRFSRLGAILCSAALIFTFSRASAIALIVCLVYYFIFGNNLPFSTRMAIILLSIITIIGVLFLAEVTLRDRLSNLDDFYRSETYTTALRAWQVRPIWGQGYSQFWPWWQRQGELLVSLRHDRWDGLTVITDYGLSLWNPHSLISYIGGEMGIVGLLLIGLMFTLVARKLLLNPLIPGLAIGLLISFVMDAVTAGTFYAFAPTVFVWWLFAIALISSPSGSTQSVEPELSKSAPRW
jgi:O-antigen ligase